MNEFVLKITVRPDGSCMVDGPIQNKGMAYSMLELARDAIQEYHAKLAASPIVAANPAQVAGLGIHKN